MVNSAKVHILGTLLGVLLLAGCGGGSSAPAVATGGPGITVVPLSGLVTTESGGTGSIGVVLNTRPTADVSIAVSSSNTAEGTVAPASVTFTSSNWNVVQVVTVTGVDDATEDGDVSYTVMTAAAVSGDSDYSGVDPSDVAALNADDDLTSIVVTPVGGLTTTEAGGSATFTVVLGSAPTADVTVALSSNDIAEGTVAPASLTFTSANFATPQTVTVTGVDDNFDDGDQPYAVSTAAAVSADASFSGKNPADVSLGNTDNDTAGITVSAAAGSTTESGSTTTFTVVLDSQPAVDVTVPLSSSDLTEGTLAPASVTFAPATWDTPQTVTLTGVDDNAVDGNTVYTAVTAPAVSNDGLYSGLDAVNVAVTNIDNDVPGILINPASGLTTTEAGSTATFAVSLLTVPTADVTVPLSSNNTAEGTVAPASLTFTIANYNTPQTVTVTGVDDSLDDGDVAYSVVTAAATSADTDYSGLDAVDALVSNTDDDTTGITVSAISGNTTEAAAGTATFTIVLDSQPTADVTVGLTTSDGTEGTVLPASVTFTAINFATARTVTVTGANDNLDDGDIPYNIVTAAATSADTSYSGVNAGDVAVINTDDDTAGFTLGAASGATTEAGGTATFTIALTSEPTASVTIDLSSGDTTEGTVPNASNVIFSNTNWNIAQKVTVTGVNDDVDDGDIVYNIVTAPVVSTDTDYSGLNPVDAPITNTDDDTAGVSVGAASGATTEATLATATFTVVLDSEPTSSVIIDLTSDDTTEGTVPAASSVIFTPNNWSMAQTVTVTGVNDDVDDGDIVYHIVTAPATSTDTNYNNVDAADAVMSSTDDDTAGIVVTAVGALTTTEAGGTATYTIVLTSEPTGGVGVGVSSMDLTEGTALPAMLTFTTLNWATPQTVTVIGVDDTVVDGDVVYTVMNAQATSTDLKYSAIDPADVVFTNTDNDVPGVAVTPTFGLVTDETGTTDSFNLVLNVQPAADVSIGLTSSDPGEASVSPASVTFTIVNWNVAQTVTVTGVDDAVVDGSQPYTIITGNATSTQVAYNNLVVADVTGDNLDNDGIAGVTVTPQTLSTMEAGPTSSSYTVVLDVMPLADVGISMTSADLTEGTVSTASLTFTPLNWSTPQTVTVTGVTDGVVDGNVVYAVVNGVAVSSDTRYNGLAVANVTVTNVDNGVGIPGVFVSPGSGLITSETGGSATYQVRLETVPATNVTLNFTSSDLTEGTVAPASLIFTPGTAMNLQVVTVTGVDDVVSDGNVGYSVTTAVTSTDANYNGIAVASVSLTNLDNEAAVATLSGNVSYAGAKTGPIYVRLNTGKSGTGMLAAGAYTMRGVPLGGYVVEAWMDISGHGTQNSTSPFGQANVVVGAGGVTGVNISLADPTGISPMQVDAAGANGFPGDGTIVLVWDPNYVGVSGTENADSYNVYWHTSAAVSKSNFLGSITGVPGNDTGIAFVTGLTNGVDYHFVVTEMVNGVEGVDSGVVGPIAPRLATGGLAISGAVILPAGVTTGGPIYVIYVDSTGTAVEYAIIPAGVSGSPTYNVSGLAAGQWSPILILDNNNNNVEDTGDFDLDQLKQLVNITSNTVNNLTLDLPNSRTSLSTSHFSSVGFDNYQLNFTATWGLKVPLSVAITAGNTTVPFDLGNSGEFDLYDVLINQGSVRPTVGDAYTLAITFTDGTSESVVVNVTGVLDTPLVQTFPVSTSTGVPAIPTFTWTVPPGTPADHLVDIFVTQGNAFLWSNNSGIQALAGAVVYNFDGSATTLSLPVGLIHNWSITLSDGDDNRVTGSPASFTP